MLRGAGFRLISVHPEDKLTGISLCIKFSLQFLVTATMAGILPKLSHSLLPQVNQLAHFVSEI